MRTIPLLTALLMISVPVAAKDKKLTDDQLLAAHREAMGAVAERTSVVAKGVCQLTILAGGSGQMQGEVTFYSAGNRTMTLIDFGQGSYNGERFGWDGNKAQVAYMVPGQRSTLGEFLFSYQELLRDGFLGGAVSTAWPLLPGAESKGKLKNEGVKKLDGVSLVKAEFRPRRVTQGLNVDFFFDPETYRLAHAEYRMRIPAALGPRPDVPSAGSVGQAAGRDTRLKLEESYRQYREVEGVPFPTEWVIRVTTETNRGTTLWEWKILFSEVAFNEEIDPAVFSLR